MGELACLRHNEGLAALLPPPPCLQIEAFDVDALIIHRLSPTFHHVVIIIACPLPSLQHFRHIGSKTEKRSLQGSEDSLRWISQSKSIYYQLIYTQLLNNIIDITHYDQGCKNMAYVALFLFSGFLISIVSRHWRSFTGL